MPRQHRFEDDDEDDFPSESKKSGTPLILALVIGGGLLLVLVIGGAFALFVTRRARAQNEEAAAVARQDVRMAEARDMGPPADARVAVAKDRRPVDAVPPAKRDFQVTAEVFANEFTKDREAFVKKYSNKTVELSGVVQAVGEDIVGNGQVSLAGDPEARLGRVLCTTTRREPWNRVLPGQTVRVVGKCPDREIGMAAMFESVILDVKGDPPPTVTADELAKEFATDPEAANAKWKNKYMVLTGRVKKVTPPADLHGTNFLLESDPAAPNVEPGFGLIYQDKVKHVRSGQRVRILVQYLSISADKDEIRFLECCLLGVDR